jgi:hypothetical protein
VLRTFILAEDCSATNGGFCAMAAPFAFKLQSRIAPEMAAAQS